MMRKLSFRLVLAIFAVFLLAGRAYALSEEQIARREPNIQAVDNTFGYIFIPSEYASQMDNLDNLDKDGVLCFFCSGLFAPLDKADSVFIHTRDVYP